MSIFDELGLLECRRCSLVFDLSDCTTVDDSGELLVAVDCPECGDVENVYVHDPVASS